MTDNLETENTQSGSDVVDDTDIEQNDAESTDVENAETKAEPTVDSEETSQDKQDEQEKRLQDTIVRAKAQEGRKVRRELEAKYQAEYAQLQNNYAQQNRPPAPDENHFWDPKFNTWVSKDISAYDYAQAVQMVETNPELLQQNNNQSAQAQAQARQNYIDDDEPLDNEAEQQLDYCQLHMDNFSEVEPLLNIIKRRMANAAATHPNGVKYLLELAIENPKEVMKISRLTGKKQDAAVYNYIKSKVNKPKPKIETKVTAQSEPLSERGKTNKNLLEMSYEEIKAMRRHRDWGI